VGDELKGLAARSTHEVVLPSLVKAAPWTDAPAVPVFSELYREHLPCVWRWVQRLSGPGADVEDLVQDIFVIAHRQLPGFRRESAVSTWLYGITARVVRDDRRKKRFRALWVRPRTDGDEAPVEPVALRSVEQEQLNRQVYRVLDALNDRYRTVLILHELEELDAPEIAELLGAKIPNVWVWLHRARQAFAKKFSELEQGEAP